jgi:hypothetical protein
MKGLRSKHALYIATTKIIGHHENWNMRSQFHTVTAPRYIGHSGLNMTSLFSAEIQNVTEA